MAQNNILQHSALVSALSQGDADADQESRAYGAIKQRLTNALAGFQPAACVALGSLQTAAAAAGQHQRIGMSGAHMAAGMELCRMSKLLLVAGNPANQHL